MKYREDLGTGYMYCYNPTHPFANKAGKIYEHVAVVQKILKRKLRKDECVHHIDHNRKNNCPTNLQVLSRRAHNLLHAAEKRVPTLIKRCKRCEERFKTKDRRRLFCSKQCSIKNKRRITITRKTLLKLVWEKPVRTVAAELGVSDVAVHKKCKSLNIKKPPQGYWLRK